MTEANPGGGSRFTLIILLAVFLAPLVGGYSWYYFGDGFRAKNYGELFHPARPVGNLELVDLFGRAVPIDRLNGKWTIMYVGPADCQQACLAQLDKVSRMRYMQGERIKRIQNIFVADGRSGDIDQVTIDSVLKPGRILTLPEANRPLFAKLFTRDHENSSTILHRIYLLDPIGNLVLSYPADADLAEIRKDLSRLLRVSQIG